MPTTIVSQIGMFCRPGRTSRARAPMMAPTTIAVMIPVMEDYSRVSNYF